MKVLFLLFFLLSCASSPTFYTVNVESISEQKKHGTSFIVVSGMSEVPSNDLRFKQYSSIVSKALKMRGFVPASGKAADFIVRLSYKVGDPSTYSETSYSHVREKLRTKHYTEYTREVVLKAYSGNSNIWETKLVSSGSSGNLPSVFPAIIAAGASFFGENVQEEVTIYETDSKIRAIASE